MSATGESLLLEVRGLNKDFGGLHALKGVDLSVPAGSVTGLIGPNGSGKTTLFNIVTGIYGPSGGKVLFRERDITGLASHAISRMGIARTFQQIRLFREMTVIENVMVGLARYGSDKYIDWLRNSQSSRAERASQLLDFVGLVGKAELRAESLPYGDQRRLEVARALATEPKLLLLDEPVAGMNPSEIADFFGLVKRINESGVSILLIEHNVRAVMGSCDLIYVFDYGRRIAAGPAAQVRCDQAVIKAYLGEEIAGVED